MVVCLPIKDACFYGRRVLISPRDHYLPQFYMRRFADEKDQVAARRISAGTQTFRVSVKNIAVERGLDDVPTDHVDDARVVDKKVLQPIEDSAKHILGGIDSGAFPPRGTDREWLSVYLAFQTFRTPYFRAYTHQLHEIELRTQSDAEFRRLRRGEDIELPEGLDSKDFEEFYEALPDHAIEFDSLLHIQKMLELAGPRGREYQQMGWRLMRSRLHDIITSDNPVVSSAWAPMYDLIVPLDARTVLIMSRRDRDSTDVGELKRHNVKDVNKRTIAGAYELLIHHPASDPLQGKRIPTQPTPLFYVEDIPIHDETDIADVHRVLRARHEEGH